MHDALFSCYLAVIYLSFLAFLNTAIRPEEDKQTKHQNHRPHQAEME
jgi:hypothetical protein